MPLPPEARRRPRLIVVATTCLVLALAYACARPPAAAPPVVPEPTSSGQVKLLFVGDVMLDTRPGKLIAAGRDPFDAFAPLFRQADVVVGNLECVIATKGTPVKKPWTFRAHPRCVPVLARHFHAVSLANNHTGDFGPDAFAEGLDLLSGNVPVFGGGRNSAEARAPLVIERNGLRIALLGYNEFKPRSFEAGPERPGVAWLTEAETVADIHQARTRADVVIPFLHWGWEGYPAPEERQRDLARRLIDAGADAVVGGHPHVTQGAELYRGRPIVYSLGNFLFDGFSKPPELAGWVLRLTVAKEGVLKWDVVTARLDEDGVPHPDLEAVGPSGGVGVEGVVLRKPD
jgi:poly-gamma-glutamate synthesis protein (capsule biosynthesis protein)